VQKKTHAVAKTKTKGKPDFAFLGKGFGKWGWEWTEWSRKQHIGTKAKRARVLVNTSQRRDNRKGGGGKTPAGAHKGAGSKKWGWVGLVKPRVREKNHHHRHQKDRTGVGASPHLS